jgi:hypothetical protein
MTTITRGQVLAAADHHRIDRHEALKRRPRWCGPINAATILTTPP